MSLKAFRLPGKDSRCICYDGQVFKIKMLMPPPEKGDIGEYLDGPSLQEEVEDIIRAVVAVPHTVEPTLMKTKHLVVKPEKKEWKLPNKVHFKEHGQPLEARPFMYLLNLKLIEEKSSSEVSKQGAKTTVENGGGKSKENKSQTATSSPVKSPSKRQRRQLYSEDAKTELHSPGSLPRKNARMAPSRSTSHSRTRYALGKRALKLSSMQRSRTTAHGGLTPDVGEMDEEEEEEEERLDEDTEDVQGEDEMSEVMGEVRMELDSRGQRSPVLESGFSRLVQRSTTLKYGGSDERGEPIPIHADLPCTGDKGPSPDKPLGGGATARVSLPVHPGRDAVEQHVLVEQLRLQEMAGPAGDNNDDQALDPQQEAKGVVRQVFDAVVTPVKNLFF